ncbi:hypothetical protein E4U40_001228 [Claviceps sp. LM458 group G5]|nr:hypothetical protein E4U40_001228 [Claviceps sp. LM458 group G5]
MVLGGAGDVRHWRKKAAKCRSPRLVVVLLQLMMRQEESGSHESSEIMRLLPSADEMDNIWKHPKLASYSQEALDYYVYVLQGRNDQERCERFLEKRFFVPQFIYNFLIRPTTDPIDVGTLLKMIESCRLYFDGAEGAKWKAGVQDETSKEENGPVQNSTSSEYNNIDQANFNLIMRLLVSQCLRYEPRLIVVLADEASRYIEHIPSCTKDAWKVYRNQCMVFNWCLELFRPQPWYQTVRQSMPNLYFWEAQRMLLTMSAGLDKPLIISRSGFQAIRDVLSGQPKNFTEAHISALHAPSWPPYIQPGDGMDELSEPEDNWSRTVGAGMLMQEAGFSKEEMDFAVDILQGLGLDGTPTIQQRIAIGNGRTIGVWEASIRSTRNAQEAWGRFRRPPEPGLEPGLNEYAAMFEKLFMREGGQKRGLLPGDKALSFQTQQDVNLTELERARLRPPSVCELYRDMKLAGIQPKGACLRILVSNAESLEMAHQYLCDSPDTGDAFRNLMREEPDPLLLMDVPLGLFAAYIQVCLRMRRVRGCSQVMRAVRLSEVRLQGVKSRWVTFIWDMIMRELERNHRALGISFMDQLDLMSRIADTMKIRAGLQLSGFTLFNKCIRKVIRREVNNLPAPDMSDNGHVQHGDLQAEEQTQRLHDEASFAVDGSDHDNPYNTAAREPNPTDLAEVATTTAVLQDISSRAKSMFRALADRERDVQRHLESWPVAPLERLNARGDAIRSEHAFEYMLSLGYLGQFEEMRRFVDWLIEQWGHTDIVSALSELGDPPLYADFSDTFCVFRLVAEPMLDSKVVEALSQRVARSGLQWTWPDGKTLQTYAKRRNTGPICALWRDMEITRDDDDKAAVQHLAERIVYGRYGPAAPLQKEGSPLEKTRVDCEDAASVQGRSMGGESDAAFAFQRWRWTAKAVSG